MSLIKNLIKEPENKSLSNKSNKEKGATDEELEAEKKVRPIIKTATDLQRLKLEKLMKNPEKPVNIPDAPRERDHMQTVPSFVRNVMGSSAGAGSGEFHVYRHLRRKEYARQKTIQAKSIREQLDDEYQQKLDDNRRLAEEKTAKKRAKRLKKKQRSGKKPKGPKDDNITHDDSTDEEDEEVEALQEEEIEALKEEEVEALQEEEVEALEDEAADEQPDNVKESDIVKTQSKEYIEDDVLVQSKEEETQQGTDLINEKNTQEPIVSTTAILEPNEVATTMKLQTENKIELLESEDNVCDKSNGK